MAEQVAVVDRAQTEILEQVAGPSRGGVQLAGGRRDELGRLGGDQAEAVADGDRLGERVNVLVHHLLVDVAVEQPGRELRVFGLLGDQRGRRLDREPVELAGRGTVEQPADRLHRDPHDVHVRQSAGRALHGADDLVDVDRLEPPVPLPHVHPGLRRRPRPALRALPVPAMHDRWLRVQENRPP